MRLSELLLLLLLLSGLLLESAVADYRQHDEPRSEASASVMGHILNSWKSLRQGEGYSSCSSRLVLMTQCQ